MFPLRLQTRGGASGAGGPGEAGAAEDHRPGRGRESPEGAAGAGGAQVTSPSPDLTSPVGLDRNTAAAEPCVCVFQCCGGEYRRRQG